MSNAFATLALTLWYLVKACVLLLAFVGAGSVWPRPAPQRFGTALSAALAAALGMGWVAAALAAFGLAGLWSPWLVGGILLACACRGAWWTRGILARRAQFGDTQSPLHQPSQPRWLTGALLGTAALIGLNCLVGALAPDSQQDSLWYHLSCARAWAEWGTLRAWPQVYPSSFTLHGSMLYAASLTLGDEVDCSMLYAMQGFLCYGIAALFAARWFGRAAGAWTWFLCATAHAANVWFVPINTGNDLTVAMFTTAGLLLTVDAFATRDGPCVDTGAFLACALLIGFAVPTKMTAIGFALAPWGIGAAWLVARGRLPVRVALAGVALACLPFALWALRGWLVGCGNPLFPMFRNLIPVRPDFAATMNNIGSGGAGGINDVYPLSPAGLAQALAAMPRKLEIAAMSRSPGFVIHAIAIGGLFSRVRVARLIGLIALFQWLPYLWTSGHSETIKYFSQCFPAVFVVAGAGAAHFVGWERMGRGIRLAAAATAVALLAGVYGSKQFAWGAIPNVGWHYRPILTHADRNRYLSDRDFGLDRIHDYDWVNRNTPRDTVVLFADSAYPLYVRRRYLWVDPGFSFPEHLAQTGLRSREQVGGWFAANGVTHVIASPGILDDWPEWAAILHRPAEAKSSENVWIVAVQSARGTNRTKPANSAE